MLNSAFNAIGAGPGDYYPEALRANIDAVNARIYDTLNNGVYKAGFATTQAAYDEAVGPLFDTLDWLKRRLADRRFLVGDNLTGADIRLFTTLVRFDAVYVGHFKCNIRRLADYPSLSAYTRDIYQWPGVAETVNIEHSKRHYYESHRSINPSGIVPVGPTLDCPSQCSALQCGKRSHVGQPSSGSWAVASTVSLLAYREITSTDRRQRRRKAPARIHC